MRDQIIGLAALLGILLTACGVYETKTPAVAPDVSAIVAGPNAVVTYAIVANAVFTSCIQCHGPQQQSAGISLDSYSGIKAHLDSVKADIASGFMPLNSALSTDQLTVFAKWINQGAPLNAADAIVSSNPSPSPIPVVGSTPSPTPANTPIPSGTPPAVVNYSAVRDAVFSPSCVSCHGPSLQDSGIRLDSYAFVFGNLSAVKSAALINKNMPVGSSLSPSQITLLTSWINLGAPDLGPVATPTPNPTITPTPTPAPGLVPTYQSIHDNVFAAKCLACHIAGGSESSRPLAPYASMIGSGMVIPGNSASSSLVSAISSGSMPPRGYTAVTAAELAVIKTWINNGALQ